MRGLLLAAMCAAVCVGAADGFAISVDAHDVECFFEDVSAGTRMSLTFQVAEGGFLDIDVYIDGPDGKEIFSAERETDGTYTFAARQTGRYTYCFDNEMSTMTPKLVVFDFVVGNSPKTGQAEDDDAKHDKVVDLVKELSEAMNLVRNMVTFQNVRNQLHIVVNEGTNSAVVWWSFFEFFLVVCMSAGQVWYIKRFFEVRSNV